MDIQDFADFDDDTLSQMAKLGLLSDKKDQTITQMKLAQALRTKARDKGMMAGDMYIPPNPMDSALDSYDRIQGMVDQRDAAKNLNNLNNQQSDSILDFLKKYRHSGPWSLPSGSTNPMADFGSILGDNPGG